MRRAARTDRNHGEIRDCLRAVGAFVLDTHGLPDCLDLLVGHGQKWILMEVKDGAKPPSARQLTPGEKETIDRARAMGLPCVVVSSIREALAAIGLDVAT